MPNIFTNSETITVELNTKEAKPISVAQQKKNIENSPINFLHYKYRTPFSYFNIVYIRKFITNYNDKRLLANTGYKFSMFLVNGSYKYSPTWGWCLYLPSIDSYLLDSQGVKYTHAYIQSALVSRPIKSIINWEKNNL